MSFGKVYGMQGHARTQPILAVAKENGVDIEVVHTSPNDGVSSDYLKVNKLGKIPTFEGKDNYVLSECIAIAVYITSQNEKTTLLGKTKQDYASILQWMSFVNSEVLPKLAGFFRPIQGFEPFNKKSVEDSMKGALKAIHIMEEHLLVHTYLVGDRLTLADVFGACLLTRGFQNLLDNKWRSENPSVTRWYQTVMNQQILKNVYDDIPLVEEALKVQPPKKEAAPKKEQPKAAPKPKPAAEEEDEPAPAPKPKHPLEALPRPTFVIDELKRKYSNEETREVALPWFWENANFEEYSLWQVDFKYNEELTMTFMSANQIGGFFARLEASRKYLFGAMSVFGTQNDSIMKGAFLVRGQDAAAAFDVAPDWESYEFTKLDPVQHKEFVNDMWAWDKPIEVDGKSYEWADGKGNGGGPSEDTVTGFLVRSTASNWSRGSILTVDAGTHLAGITRILEQDFPKVSHSNGISATHEHDIDSPSPKSINFTFSDGASSQDSSRSSRSVSPRPPTTLLSGPFAGLPFPHLSARANAVHVVREHVSTYLITHPHLDHLSGFVVNTAAFHNTSKPKKLAALPFTVNAIKTHIFNDIIWPNLTDEDGGVGLVSFQRLAEGGNIALGEGPGKGYIEVCDGLGVRGLKVSHGHCMKGPGHVHRGSNAHLPEDSAQGRSLSVSQGSAPGTPLLGTADSSKECVIDSSAYFIRTEMGSGSGSSRSNSREILMFGDVEPDSLSLTPRTASVWAAAAPKIVAGVLTGIFIECSYSDAQGDSILFGHLAPRHLVAELVILGEMVKDARTEFDRERAEARLARKRKRASASSLGLLNVTVGEDLGRRNSRSRREFRDGASDDSGRASPSPMDQRGMKSSLDSPSIAPTIPTVPTFAASTPVLPSQYHAPTPAPVPNGQTPVQTPAPASPAATPTSVGQVTSQPQTQVEEQIPPLKGLTVVVMHVKDTHVDGPPVGDRILRELERHEMTLAEDGRGLGCRFEVSQAGASYWF
ncbi:hypothetical protein K490DRAFT_42769 [Saccharata proteae CBS 121410]|uniref:EF1G-domain-containing protein n=1 Tax=Saccharata proteae CBS 121410 TaxID=1314787 RepID=A0A9P4LYI0_9PEZI|nr:hypothetical protein K490DRAFT_42769 [Saccharata proteae CBS 121410]